MGKIETLYTGKFLELLREGPWEYANRVNSNGAVVIAALTPEKKFLLVEQYRIPCHKNVIELPAGIAGDSSDTRGETLEQAARRELQEETGYEAGRMEFVLTGATSAGLTSELVTLFLALDLRRTGQGGGVQSEQITLHEIPLDSAEAWLRQRMKDGELVDHKVFAALYFLRARANS
jgi:ADP-ribose pyrophosphatase